MHLSDPSAPGRRVPARAPGGGRRGHSALVDARALQPAGLGRYLREILAVLLHDPRFSRVTLLGSTDELGSFVRDQGPEMEVRTHPYPQQFYGAAPQLAWLRLWLQGATRADVTFFPHYDTPLLRLPARSVVTVHDLIHFKVPEAFPALRRAGAGVMLRSAVAAAGRVITVSEHTRKTLLERLPWAAPKAITIPNGVSAFFRDVSGEACPASVLAVGGAPFLLCVGNRKAHKNLGAAVRVLSLLRPRWPELRLVLAGRWYPDGGDASEQARALGVEDSIVELAGVEDEALRWLYSHCEALLFPSLHEGFGLPVLEAMACGAPVIASDRSSLPEVVGTAGFLFDPHDAAGMAGAVERLRSEPDLRRRVADRGRERAAGFSWTRTAQRTVDLLDSVARRGEGRIAPAATLGSE
ncbi:MAG TPA: glycosyltransferase family 1 protein [Longimicrobiaceae bacterium]|nr:glycosyltransferase family 1 protein [Longimicrobiaceae bacterium]